MKKPLISIVVPTHNREQWLRAAMETLVRQKTDEKFLYEIIVVDNASTDDTGGIVQRIAKTSHVPVQYALQETPGDAPTRNMGVERSSGRWIAFFDDDQFAEPDWLVRLYDAALQTSAPVVGGAVRLDLPEEELARLGAICREVLREVDYYDTVHPYTGKNLPGCGNVLVARGVFDSIGRFDTAMVNGGSDSDFFLRAQESGCKLWYTPQAVIRHRVPPERLTDRYFRWDALQGADNIACFDYQRHGACKLALLSVARLGQAVLVHLPMFLWARLRGTPGEILGRRTRLWRAEGYIRRAISLIAPKIFPQKKFLESLNFNKGHDAM